MAGINHMDNTNIDTMRIGQTTYTVRSFYDGELSLMELLQNALRRDAQAVLRQMDRPDENSETT